VSISSLNSQGGVETFFRRGGKHLYTFAATVFDQNRPCRIEDIPYNSGHTVRIQLENLRVNERVNVFRN